MAKDRKKVLHIHSSVEDRQPTPASLELGEIAVNNNAGHEFISVKNSQGKVARISSDSQVVNWMEYKEVIPYSGVVDNVHLDTNKSNIEIKLNQVVASNTKMHNIVNGAKDIDNQPVNPTTDSGLTNGAGFAIDMSRYAMIGANPSFSSVTTTCNATLQGTTNIIGSNGSCGSELNVNVNGFNITGNTIVNSDITFKDDIIISGNGFNTKLEWKYGDVTDKSSGSTNFASDNELWIPKDASHLNRRKVSWTYDNVCNASGGTYDPGQENDSSFKIPSSVAHLKRQTLSWSYGSVTNANAASYDPGANDGTGCTANTSFVIPQSIDNLTNWNGTCINLPHDVCVTGTLTATGGIYTSSDSRLKENITYIGGHDISKASKVRLNAFNYKSDASKRKVYGVIAQDLESVGLTELVHYDENGMRSVDYTGLLLLKIAALEKEIDMLKHKIEEKNN